MRYVFFPLHTEPEVSLLVYGRPFLNQIEVIRQIAISLPIDVHLVVKEHPWMVGKRKYSSYAKLLNIPRVHLARPEMTARDLIEKSALVAVITGSVGLEAAILRKPVITFGDCAFNALPLTMVRRCNDLRELPSLVRTMLDHHEHDEAALESYVAAVFELSESVNLYSALLEKKGVYREDATSFTAEVEKLATYTLKCMQGRPDPAIERAAAAW
jgi:capsule polysaccharide export protein KpsC/LpsZ